MHINADFSRPAVLAAQQQQWVASPQGGVERVMLDRIGAEQARATSLVRYAPDAFFPRHEHPGGEEILVLEGVFSEDGEHFPAGWYLRNPPGSSHRPSSGAGAVIFVKLQQMLPHDRQRVRIDTRDLRNWRQKEGRAICPLFFSPSERVVLQRLEPAQQLLANAGSGLELLVLEGTLLAGPQTYERRSWMRLPAGDLPDMKAGEAGATIYLKTRHLPRINMKDSA